MLFYTQHKTHGGGERSIDRSLPRRSEGRLPLRRASTVLHGTFKPTAEPAVQLALVTVARVSVLVRIEGTPPVLNVAEIPIGTGTGTLLF